MDALEYEALRDKDTTGDVLAAAWSADLARPNRRVRSHRAPHARMQHAARSLAAVVTATAIAVGTGSAIMRDDTSHNVAQAPPPTELDALPDVVSGIGDVSAVRAERAERAAQGGASRADRRSAMQLSRSHEVVRRQAKAPRYAQPVTKGRVTSCYGPRWGRTHKGVDFAAPSGTRIRAAQAGTVVQAGWRYGGLGYSVIIKHGDRSMTLYAHASRVLVRTNQKVSAGTSVALVGSTGNSTGPHLHFAVARATSLGQVWNNFTNPAPWLHKRGLSAGRCA